MLGRSWRAFTQRNRSGEVLVPQGGGAFDGEGDASDEGLGGEKERGATDLLRVGEPSYRLGVVHAGAHVFGVTFLPDPLLHHRRVHVAGTYTVDPDTLMGVVERQGFREPDDAALRGAVGDGVALPGEGNHARHAYDRPPRLAQGWDGRLATEKDALEVQREEEVPMPVGSFEDVARDVGAGVVDQRV